MAKKNINPRCPLAVECGRKTCEYTAQELDCVYYESNGYGENAIPDQDLIREEREAARMKEAEEMAMEELEEVSEPSKIVMLPVSSLYPHKDNPRKDVGDVTELAESIKANGVLQNLTVVPGAFDGNYIVIIGHRRLAAAKLAGLETVPCAIVKMTHEEQIATMLTENMQRTDLTVYEQAKAFQQLSIDLGMSVAEISDMSGFSETTIRRRTKLADLDEKAFKKACDRGATLFDFAELDKVEDPEAKQKCLEAIGTANFKNEIKTAIDAQRTKQKLAEWVKQIDAFATRIEKKDYIGFTENGEFHGDYCKMNYVRNFGSWSRNETIEAPEDAGEVRYFYIVGKSQIDVYKEFVEDSSEEQARREREKIREADEATWERMQDIMARHKALRREFILEFGAVKSNVAIIMRNAADAMIYQAKEVGYYSRSKPEDLCGLLDIPFDKDRNRPDRDAFSKLKNEQPERVMLIMAYWLMESCGEYARQSWCADKQRYVITFADNQQLDDLYYFLEELGYERSDEERQMSRGTHELFYKEEE